MGRRRHQRRLHRPRGARDPPHDTAPGGAGARERIADGVATGVRLFAKYAGPVLVAFAIVLPWLPFANRYVVDIATLVVTYIMLGWGLNIVVGLAGMLDLGYVAFYASAPIPLRSSRFIWTGVLGLPAARRRLCRALRCPSGRPGAQAQGRLSCHRDPRLRRDDSGDPASTGTR